MSYPIITCPTDCTYEVPAIDMDECAPFVDFDEIDHIYLTGLDQGLTDWRDLAEWTARLSDDGGDIDDIRDFHVRAELAKPEYNVVDISLKRTVETEKKFSITASEDETNTTNYDAMRQMQCHVRYLMWYSAGRFMYGGTNGIEVDVQANHIITPNEELNYIELVLMWRADHHPERIDNPLI